MGRTARAGKEGRAVSLVAPQDVGLVRAIEENTGAKMTELELDASRVAEILVQVNTAVRGGPAAGRITRGRKSSCRARTRRRRRRNLRHRRKLKLWRSSRE